MWLWYGKNFIPSKEFDECRIFIPDKDDQGEELIDDVKSYEAEKSFLFLCLKRMNGICAEGDLRMVETAGHRKQRSPRQ